MSTRPDRRTRPTHVCKVSSAIRPNTAFRDDQTKRARPESTRHPAVPLSDTPPAFVFGHVTYCRRPLRYRLSLSGLQRGPFSLCLSPTKKIINTERFIGFQWAYILDLENKANQLSTFNSNNNSNNNNKKSNDC